MHECMRLISSIQDSRSMHEQVSGYWTEVSLASSAFNKGLPDAVALTQPTKELWVPDLGQETFRGVFRHISNTSLSTVGLFKQPHMLCDGVVLDYLAV